VVGKIVVKAENKAVTIDKTVVAVEKKAVTIDKTVVVENTVVIDKMCEDVMGDKIVVVGK
jgi:hypothetical protein